MRWIFVLTGLFALGGWYRYAPIEVTVRNAVTKEPQAGAEITVEYPRFMEFFPPRGAGQKAKTDGDGKATVPVAVNYKSHQASVYVEDLFLDQPFLARLVDLPVNRYTIVEAEARKSGREVQPIPLVIDVLTLQQHRERYRDR